MRAAIVLGLAHAHDERVGQRIAREQRRVELAAQQVAHLAQAFFLVHEVRFENARIGCQRRAHGVFRPAIGVRIHVDLDLDLVEHGRAERRDRVAHVEKGPEQHDRDADGADRRDLHGRVPREVRENLTQKEPNFAPVHDGRTPALRP
jgi:hypothetical protein